MQVCAISMDIMQVQLSKRNAYFTTAQRRQHPPVQEPKGPSLHCSQSVQEEEQWACSAQHAPGEVALGPWLVSSVPWCYKDTGKRRDQLRHLSKY